MQWSSFAVNIFKFLLVCRCVLIFRFVMLLRDITMLRWKQIGWLLMTIVGMRFPSLASDFWHLQLTSFNNLFNILDRFITIFYSLFLELIFLFDFLSKLIRFYALQFFNPRKKKVVYIHPFLTLLNVTRDMI